MIRLRGEIRARVPSTQKEKEMYPGADEVQIQLDWNLLHRQVNKETIEVSSYFERVIKEDTTITLNAEDLRKYIKAIDAVINIYREGEEPGNPLSGYDSW
jgi:hypothetical protein